MRALVAGLGLLLAACVPTVSPDLAAAGGKTIVLFIGTPHEVGGICERWNLPGSVACVSIAQTEERRRTMMRVWVEAVGGIDCIVAAPPSIGLIEHEVRLWGQGSRGGAGVGYYWNKGAPGR